MRLMIGVVGSVKERLNLGERKENVSRNTNVTRMDLFGPIESLEFSELN